MEEEFEENIKPHKRFRYMTAKEQDEYHQKQVVEKKEKLANVTQDEVELELGYCFGELIFHRYLPTLNIDSIHTRNLIYITAEENEIFIELEAKWSAEYDKDRFEELLKFRRLMQAKYLPPVLKCFFPNTFVKNWDSFKQGLRNSLWDCDICHYEINGDDDIEIDNSDIHGTIIRLKLAKD